MESAARQSSPRVGPKLPRRADLIDLPAAVGVEATARAESHSRRAKPQRRRTAQIPSSRRAKKTTLSPLRPSRAKSRAQIPSRRGSNDDSEKQLCAVSRAQIPSRRGFDDDAKKQLRAVSRAQISHGGCLFDDSNRQGHPNWVGARARTTKRRRYYAPPDDDDTNNNKQRRSEDFANPEVHGLIDLLLCPPDNNNWRDWANLADGPAGLIADRVLAYDVADYVRFRAVCLPWRQCSSEPRTHSGLDRRFHPWRWTMLREKRAVPDRPCFLNTSTGEYLKVDIPELHDHKLLSFTTEGLLVLVHKTQRATVRLFNPLTRHLIELPPLTKLLPTKYHYKLLENYFSFDWQFTAWGSGIANDDSAVVLCLDQLQMIGMAKPGDDSWNLLEYNGQAPLMFAGRFYCVNLSGVMMLEMGADQPPKLTVAAKLGMHVSSMLDSVHLVNNCGELMLVHRRCGRRTARNKSGRAYDVYRVDLDTRRLFRVKSLGGNSVFMGLYCSLLVSPDVFPSSSISADTIYLSLDFNERMALKAAAYHLADGSVETPCSLVPGPRTLIDCLSLAITKW